jgi:hypothetical protein
LTRLPVCSRAIQSRLQKYRHLWFLLPLLILAFVVILLAFVWPRAENSRRGLKPFRPSSTPGGFVVESEASVVTFPELNANPNAYRNQRLRVTGDYVALTPPDCRPYSGPLFYWSLVTEELQLNATGFEALLRNVPANTTLTVEGVWRLYDGPLGCGKEPAEGIAWYLAVERIISPNPLPGFRGTPRATAEAGEFMPTLPPELSPLLTPPTSTPTPSPEANSPTPGISATPTLVGTPTLGSPTPTPTAGTGTVFPSVTPVGTGLPGIMTVTPTLPPGTTATPSATPGPGTPTSGPPMPTLPGGGYPGATATPNLGTPTPTPDPY